MFLFTISFHLFVRLLLVVACLSFCTLRQHRSFSVSFTHWCSLYLILHSLILCLALPLDSLFSLILILFLPFSFVLPLSFSLRITLQSFTFFSISSRSSFLWTQMHMSNEFEEAAAVVADSNQDQTTNTSKICCYLYITDT